MISKTRFVFKRKKVIKKNKKKNNGNKKKTISYFYKQLFLDRVVKMSVSIRNGCYLYIKALFNI